MSNHKILCPYCKDFSNVVRKKIDFKMGKDQLSKCIMCPDCKQVFGVQLQDEFNIITFRQNVTAPEPPEKLPPPPITSHNFNVEWIHGWGRNGSFKMENVIIDCSDNKIMVRMFSCRKGKKAPIWFSGSPENIKEMFTHALDCITDLIEDNSLLEKKPVKNISSGGNKDLFTDNEILEAKSCSNCKNPNCVANGGSINFDCWKGIYGK